MLTGVLQIYAPSIIYYYCGVYGKAISLVPLLKTDLKSLVAEFMGRRFLV